MYSHLDEFPPKYGKYTEDYSSRIFSCIRASANTGPACIREKINSPRFFLHVLVLCQVKAVVATVL